jgi:TctA family transporter
VFSHQISGGDIAFILTRPIALTMLALLVLSLCYPMLVSSFRRWRSKRSTLGASRD